MCLKEEILGATIYRQSLTKKNLDINMIICFYFTWVLSGTVDAGIQHIFTSRHEGFNIHLPKNSHRYVSAHILCIHVQVFHVNCSWEFFPLTLVFKVIPSSSTKKNSVNNVVSHPSGFMGRYERDEYSHTGGCKSLIKIKIAKLQYRKNSTVCKHRALKTSLKGTMWSFWPLVALVPVSLYHVNTRAPAQSSE